MMVTRYAAEVSYNGAPYFGWQIQPDRPSVQEALEKVLSMLDKRPVSVTGAGRTDSGVRELRYAASTCRRVGRIQAADGRQREPRRSHVNEADKGQARISREYDAVAREYVYFMWTGRTIYPHITPFVHWVKGGGRDWSLAEKACRLLEGEHDFTNFCRASNVPDDPVRTIYRARLRRRGDLMWFRIKGNGFLTNMVRMIMGDLELIAKGERGPEWLLSLMMPGFDRSTAGMTFPPNGLFLWKIDYREPLWNSHNGSL